MTRGELERENVELKRDLARYANAHIILMVERESMQSRLDVLEREKQQCNRPPTGWMCMRGAYHDGPCAAVETNDG